MKINTFTRFMLVVMSLLIAFSLTLVNVAAMKWAADGIPVCTAPREQYLPQITPDDSGGAIITWQDYRSGTNFDIYAQRVDADGSIHAGWPLNGRAVCTDASYQSNPQITPDGSGGAIITWEDSRSGLNIYAQRIDANGSIHAGWPTNGLAICTAAGAHRIPRICPDGSGGAIITWYKDLGTGDHIYAQRVDASGSIPASWPVNGLAICTATGHKYAPRITSDGSGGAIIAWRDYRSGTNDDIYAQRVNTNGSIPAGWPAGGLAICTEPHDQYDPDIRLDGSGGAIIVWHDWRLITSIYAQKVDADGSIHAGWPVDGLAVCTATDYQYFPKVTPDGSGGAIFTWFDHRSGTNFDIYAQKVDADGSIHAGWPVNGIAVCTAPGDQQQPQITPDGSGGAVITWRDRRSGTDDDIYAHMVNADGSLFADWPADGLAVCTAEGEQHNHQITPDGSGGAIIAWRDARLGANDDIYAQGVTRAAYTWYLAEGSTDGGMETWVLVQNPNADAVTVDLTFMTSGSPVNGPQDYPIPANSRHSFRVNDYVTDYEVSTKVEAQASNVICERAMYGGGNTWAHDSIGVTDPAPTWYLAEGCTDGGMETWVLVLNPNANAVTVDLTFMTSGGPVNGPQGYPIAPNSRHSFKVNDYVTDYEVSTKVEAQGGDVVCERAMYGNKNTWAHDSIGVTAPDYTWYLAEGCTDGGMETWVLVQNPNPDQITVDLTFMTSGGPVNGPQGYPIAANSRHSFKVNDYVTDFNVSTKVTSDIGRFICERAMYGGGNTWAHDSIGVTDPAPTWYLAEGCTDGGMETWVLVQNPNANAVTVDLTFMTSGGPVNGPQGYPIAANSRHSFKVNDYVTDYEVSTKVEAQGGDVICERAMYGNNNTWAHDSVGYAP